MQIQGTDKIRGALDLSSIKQQITKGQILPINDSDFYKSDIQMALNSGYLEAIGSPLSGPETKKSTTPEKRMIKFKNTYVREISLKQIDRGIPVGETFYLPEDDINTPYISDAIAKGMITPEEAAGSDTQDLTETVLDLSKEFEETKKPMPRFSTRKLDTNEEIDIDPSNVITDENPPPVTAKDIGDPRKTSGIVWNPTQQNVSQPPKKKGPVVTATKRSSKTTKSDNNEVYKNIVPINVIDNPNPMPVKAKDLKKSASQPAKSDQSIVKDAIVHDSSGNKIQQDKNDITFVDQVDEEKHLAVARQKVEDFKKRKEEEARKEAEANQDEDADFLS